MEGRGLEVLASMKEEAVVRGNPLRRETVHIMQDEDVRY